MSQTVSEQNKEYKRLLLAFTVLIPLTTALCLLLAVLVFVLYPVIWWFGMIVILFGVVDFAMYFPIRKYTLSQLAEEPAAAPAEDPAEGSENVPDEQPSRDGQETSQESK